MGHRAQTSGRRIAAVLTLAGLIVFAFLGSSASAGKVHVYSHSLGAGELSLTPQSGIGVDQETGEVYIADSKHSRVAKFSESGSAEGALATVTEPSFIAVDNSAGPSKGDIYVVGEGLGTVTKLSPLGVPVVGWGTEELGERKGHLKGLAEIAGIAVDAQGDLWIFSRNEVTGIATMREFDQADAGQEAEAGTTLSEFTIHIGGEPRDITGTSLFIAGVGLHGIAVGSAHVYAFRDFNERQATLERLTLDGKADEVEPGSGSILGNRANGVTIDPSDGDVYVSEAEPTSGTAKTSVPPDIQRYTSAGAPSAGASGFETFGGGFEGLRPDNCEIKVVHGTETECKVVDGLNAIGALSIRSSTGAVYAVDPFVSDVAVYTLEEVEPPSVVLDPPTSITQTSAQLTGHINPNAAHGSTRAHEVVWRFECTPECPEQASGHFEADGQEHTVATTVAGLEAGTKYDITLVAENRGGNGRGTREVVTAPAPPGAKTGLASEVGPREATLNAVVNSNGAAATYHFEYVTKPAFDTEGFARAQTTPESEPLPALAAPRDVSEPIGGLEPATEYVFRVVAVNSLGTTNGAPESFRSQIGPNPLETNCPNQELRTGPGARLPDCRAYELVSPTEKQGSPVEPYETILQASAAGNTVTWFTGGSASDVPSPGEAGHQDAAFYLSTAGSAGWSSQRLLPPEAQGNAGDLLGLTEDGRYALLESFQRGAGQALYLLDTADQRLTTVVAPLSNAIEAHRAFTYDGSNEGDTLFFFESRLQLPTKVRGTAGKNNLYMWDRETGEVSLVGILPGVKGETPAGGSFGGAYSWFSGLASFSSSASKGQRTVGGSEAGLYVGALHAISSSGNDVVFTTGEGTAPSDQLFLRRGLTGGKPTTVRISVANADVSDSNGEQPAAFQEATRSGEMVFFISSGKLTQNANTGPSDEGSDLYRYDVGTKTLVDVTPEPAGAGARVDGLLGAAEDGRSGYLAAQGVLASGGVEGEDNLYHFEETSDGGFSYRFVAALRPGAKQETNNWSPTGKTPKTARVSADGGTLLFMSQLPLNGEQRGPCIGSRCAEVYRYSFDEGVLACVSCNPSAKGLSMSGAELGNEAIAPTLPSSSAPIYGSLPRNLSSSGTRVFFQSSEGLLPEDTNGNGQNCSNPRRCVDVYEWETVGTGSCTVANQAGGCLYLLSSGNSAESSMFVDASADGSDAFMITSSQLVPIDEDELADMYDVRVEGGLPSQHSQAPVPCGSAEACKGSSSSPSPATSPGTQSFQGPGNPRQRKSKRCKKGAVRKHGRCVKKPKYQKKHPKKKNQKKRDHKSRPAGNKRSGGKSK